MMFDPEGILSNKVSFKIFNNLAGGFEESPGARLSQTDNSNVGMNVYEQIAIYGENFDVSNLHRSVFISLLSKSRKSKVESRKSKVEGRRSKVEGRRSKVESRRSFKVLRF